MNPVPIFAALLVDLSDAERAQAMVDKNVYSAVIVGLVLAVMGLFSAFILSVRKANSIQDQRVEDMAGLQTKLEALSKDLGSIVKENTQTLFILGQRVEQLAQRKRSAPAVPTPKKESAG
jgi:predicted histidine transporter YuiF (NhaC family)